ncbi:MAG: nascent polypeptide-associated complex protein [Candidatus Micrarchaeia archaeon]
MIPNLDPRALKSMMDKLGMKSKEIEASKVVIEGVDKDIVIENPQVLLIQMQGEEIWQITGKHHEQEKGKAGVEISDEDINFVSEQSGVSDRDLVKKVIESCNGDLAEAIMKLKSSTQ